MLASEPAVGANCSEFIAVGNVLFDLSLRECRVGAFHSCSCIYDRDEPTLNVSSEGWRALRGEARPSHRGLAIGDGALIVAARGEEAFTSVEDLWRRAGVPVAALERLAEADAFGSLGLGRRQALWEVRALGSGVDRYGRKSRRSGSS